MSDYVLIHGQLVSADELYHWKYIYKKKLRNGKWKYYYDTSEIDKYAQAEKAAKDKIKELKKDDPTYPNANLPQTVGDALRLALKDGELSKDDMWNRLWNVPVVKNDRVKQRTKAVESYKEIKKTRIKDIGRGNLNLKRNRIYKTTHHLNYLLDEYYKVLDYFALPYEKKR